MLRDMTVILPNILERPEEDIQQMITVLNANEDDEWCYKLVPGPTTDLFRIAIYDECGDFIIHWAE